MKNMQGFSLLEMAIVLLIIGLLMGGLMGPLGVQMEASRIKDTQNQINNIQDALYGFLAANGRLPCPANAGSAGNEAAVVAIPPTGQCASPYNGFIPGRQLGLGPLDTNGYVLDAWGQPIRYAVANLTEPNAPNHYVITFANGIRDFQGATTGLAGFGSIANVTASSPSTNSAFLSVCSAGAPISSQAYPGTSWCGNAGNVIANDAVAVVYSTGPNAGGIATGADEAANPSPSSANNDSAFVAHVRSENGAAGGYFDDIVAWIPRSILVSKLLTAGRLP